MTSPFGATTPAGISIELFQIFLYNLVGNVLGAVLQPLSREIAEDLNTRFPNLALSPEQVAELVVRAGMTEGEAIVEAARSGLDPKRFQGLLHLAGEAPGPLDLAEALRRGIIHEFGRDPNAITFEQGIAESRLYNKWGQVVQRLAVREPTPNDALDALLEGQIEEADAQALYQRFGGEPQYFELLFNTRGTAPTPIEALEMANRRIIPWDGHGPDATSFEQAFLEGPWRNKWLESFRRLGEHLPPPRTVVALVRGGAISDDKGAQLLQQSGLSAELAQAYIEEAHHTKLAQDKQLAKADIEQLYRDQVIGREDATKMLTAMHWTDQEAAYLLDLQDLKRVVAGLNGAIGRVHNYYVNRKIDKAQALGALGSLHVPEAQVRQLLDTWDVELSSNVKQLSPAEIASAFFYKVIDQDTAMAELTAQGWTPLDAWIILSVRMHTAQPNRPAPGPVPLSG